MHASKNKHRKKENIICTKKKEEEFKNQHNINMEDRTELTISLRKKKRVWLASTASMELATMIYTYNLQDISGNWQSRFTQKKRMCKPVIVSMMHL